MNSFYDAVHTALSKISFIFIYCSVKGPKPYSISIFSRISCHFSLCFSFKCHLRFDWFERATTPHLNGHSNLTRWLLSKWMDVCCFKLLLLEKVFTHVVHLKGFKAKWTESLCLFRLVFCVKLIRHFKHLCGFYL